MWRRSWSGRDRADRVALAGAGAPAWALALRDPSRSNPRPRGARCGATKSRAAVRCGTASSTHQERTDPRVEWSASGPVTRHEVAFRGRGCRPRSCTAGVAPCSGRCDRPSMYRSISSSERLANRRIVRVSGFHINPAYGRESRPLGSFAVSVTASTKRISCVRRAMMVTNTIKPADGTVRFHSGTDGQLTSCSWRRRRRSVRGSPRRAPRRAP